MNPGTERCSWRSGLKRKVVFARRFIYMNLGTEVFMKSGLKGCLYLHEPRNRSVHVKVVLKEKWSSGLIYMNP